MRVKKKQVFAILAAAMMLIPAYGCTPAANRESGFAGDIGPNRGIRNTATYVFRPDIADHLRTHIPGVSQASVFVRGNNAYVAVNNLSTPRTGNIERVVPQGGTTGVPSVDGRAGGYIGGTNRIVPNLSTTPTTPTTPATPGYPAPGATTPTLPNGPGATIGRTALSPMVKQRVATEVRRVDPAIHNVYVSDDPALLSRFRGYGTGSLRSATDDFNNMIRQFFPGTR